MKSQAGFTLMEMLLAAAVAGMVMAAMSACLSMAMRVHARETQHAGTGARAAAEHLLRLLGRQLASTHPQVQGGDAAAELSLRGDSSSVQFPTRVSLRGTSNGAPVLARYDVGGGQLVYSEMPLPPVSMAYTEPEPDDFRTAVTVPGVWGSFAYLRMRRPRWEPAWRWPGELPESVDITFTLENNATVLRRRLAPAWLDMLEWETQSQ